MRPWIKCFGLPFLIFLSHSEAAFAGNWQRSQPLSQKSWDRYSPKTFAVIMPPPNMDGCNALFHNGELVGDRLITFDITHFENLLGSSFDANRIFIDGIGGGKQALSEWIKDWTNHGANNNLPGINQELNWSSGMIRICVGGGVQLKTFDSQLRSMFIWYDSPTEVPYLTWWPKDHSVGTPMNMSDPADALAVSGNGNKLRDLNGYGINTMPTEAPVPSKPDFEVKKTWLTTIGGTEQYTYNFTDEIKMNAQFENTGPGSIPGSSYVYSRFYLSRGYKEDAHSDWVRVGTDQTLGNNLDPGETHSEQEGLKIWQQDIIKPGKTYNIVVCIDRTADSGNGSGDWAEKHESNNCSTEAVFTVNGSFNFKVSTLTLSTGSAALTPGQVFDVTSVAQNIGTDNAAIDTRIGYYLSGPNITGEMLIGTNQIKEANFAAGVSKTEILSGITAPSDVGTFTLKACTDYDDRVVENNETDNCKTVTFTVAIPSTPNPAPKKTTPAVTGVLFGS